MDITIGHWKLRTRRSGGKVTIEDTYGISPELALEMVGEFTSLGKLLETLQIKRDELFTANMDRHNQKLEIDEFERREKYLKSAGAALEATLEVIEKDRQSGNPSKFSQALRSFLRTVHDCCTTTILLDQEEIKEMQTLLREAMERVKDKA